MMTFSTHGCRAFLAGVALLAGSYAPASAFEVNATECLAPSNPGGGWDFTCRQVGKALYDLKIVPSPVQVTNMAGSSGGVAYAAVVHKRNAENNLIVAASSATTTRLAQRGYPGMNMKQVRWVGTVGADYGAISVAADSDIKSLPDLMAKLKANPSLALGGGSGIGAWDHLKMLLVAKAAGIKDLRKVKHVAFDGGADALTQLIGGHLKAVTGDLSEVTGFLESGHVRVLAVLAPERLPGAFASIPTAKEQGIDVVAANWRGFYVPGGASDDAYNYWVSAVRKVYDSKEWKQVMTGSGLMPLGLYGAAFDAFVANQIAQTEEISKEIGIIK